MLDLSWLGTLDERRLTDLYDDCRVKEKEHRSSGRFGLSYFWGQCAIQCCDAISRLYDEELVGDGQLDLVWYANEILLGEQLRTPDPPK